MGANTIAFPAKQRPSTEQDLLKMILDNSQIHNCAIRGKSVMTVLLTDEQVDCISRYEAGKDNLEDGHDAEQAGVA